ncbi:MAG: DUF3649 domain-containing protein [Pseudomonas sp.]|uniref:DUF3649 domain-containing protein n=1 Tax=Pseudomonas sp. TaxID=306 RepID=UPI00339A0ABC
MSLTAAAVFGGYALTSGLVIFLGAVLPLPRSQAVLAASLASFTVYTLAIVWVFAVRDSRRAWWGLLLPAALFALLGTWLGSAT